MPQVTRGSTKGAVVRFPMGSTEYLRSGGWLNRQSCTDSKTFGAWRMYYLHVPEPSRRRPQGLVRPITVTQPNG